MRSVIQYFVLGLAVLGILIPAEAAAVQSDEYFAWGIDIDDIAIPVGSVITEAVLTIQNPSSTDLYVHLLDNPDTGIEISPDEGQGNVFDGFGEPLEGQAENGNLVFRFSEIDDEYSDVWSANAFQRPFNFTLADNSTVQYTSSLLKLIDYAGTGRSFGLGIDSDTGVSLDGITLDITVSAYTDQGTNYSTSFAVDLNDDLIMTPDFNGDGMTDLLWRQTSTGEQVIQLMNGLQKGQSVVLGANPDWPIVGLGDFNGDGMTDLLWRQTSTGVQVIQLMNGLQKGQSVVLGADPDWPIVGLGDFNGDGMTDLLWRQTSTGEQVIQLMNGLQKGQSVVLGADLDWPIVGLGDFNGDGMADLLWRQTSTGRQILQLMNGLQKGQSVVLGANLDWPIVGLGDFNGDGMADLLWRQTSTGRQMIQLMNGLQKGQSMVLGANLDWPVVFPASGMCE